MKIEKLPSGSYRIRKMYNGTTYTVVFDHKPTQKEVVESLAEKLNTVQEKRRTLTFRDAAEEYIESKRNVLSPSTLRGYKNILQQLPSSFTGKNLHDITALDVQARINALAKDKSPKTVRNYHGFLSAVLSMFRPNLKLTTTLPQKIKQEPYIPSDQDVQRILERSRGTMYEVPLVLACYGMRRSEIFALVPEDIDGDIVRINKALVQDDLGKWKTKSTKTTAGTREIIIPEHIARRIQEQGYVYKGGVSSISAYLSRTQDELGIPRFSIHKLRHYFASKMSALQIPEADILKLGGWESDYIMKSVYRHSMMEKEEKAKRTAALQLQSVLFHDKTHD